MLDMAIVKATYTKSSGGAKASIRYLEHRPGKDGAKITRTLWGIDGKMERGEAYRMIDEADKGSIFFRFVISPDPTGEDTGKDLFLREITEHTLLTLEERLQKQIQWVASTHDDHAPHRHVHVIAVIKDRLTPQDFQAMRQKATEIAMFQRKQRDHIREYQAKQQKGEQWELHR